MPSASSSPPSAGRSQASVFAAASTARLASASEWRSWPLSFLSCSFRVATGSPRMNFARRAATPLSSRRLSTTAYLAVQAAGLDWGGKSQKTAGPVATAALGYGPAWRNSKHTVQRPGGGAAHRFLGPGAATGSGAMLGAPAARRAALRGAGGAVTRWQRPWRPGAGCGADGGRLGRKPPPGTRPHTHLQTHTSARAHPAPFVLPRCPRLPRPAREG